MLVTFTIRRGGGKKPLPLFNIGNSCPNISQSLPWLDLLRRRGALRSGGCQCKQGSNTSNTWSCALFHPLRGTARPGFVTESHRGSPQSTGPPPKSLVCLCSWRNPCSPSCREGRPRAQLTQQSPPFFLRAHVQVLFPHFKVPK